MLRMSLNGFFFETVPAMMYWKTMMSRCMMMMSTNTLANTLMIWATVPA